MNQSLQLRLLGAPEIRLHDQPLATPVAAKAQALLYYLALTGRAHTRTALAGLLWGDMPEETARTNLRKALADLRPLVGDYLLTDNQMIALRMEQSIRVDALEFATQVKAQNDQALSRAVDLYGGDLLEGFYVRNAPDFESWLLTERTHYRQAVLQALHALATQQAEQGNLGAAITTQRRLLALEPWAEDAQRTLMQWLAQSGQRSAALAQYDLCRRTLEAELAVEPDEETTALYEQIRAGKIDKVTRRQGDKGSDVEGHPVSLSPPHLVSLSLPSLHNLPEPTTPLVGRQRELAQIQALLADPACRLLTITGPGGMGKTRLALAAAGSIYDLGFTIYDSSDDKTDNPKSKIQNRKFPDGIFFVALAAITTPAYILPTIADALGLRFAGSLDVQTQLTNYLREKELLLVLDNLEQLMHEVAAGSIAAPAEASSALLLELLQAAPGLKLLATSREPLNLPGEWLVELAGLSTPTAYRVASEGASFMADRALNERPDSDAVALFLQCARRLQANFTLNAQELAAVVRICRLVDGLPLGIELAASWVRALSCDEIADEIEQNLNFLTTNQRGVPTRHRSMQAVFDHSWQLLAEEEQRVLAGLSIFRGGFTRQAATAVTGATLAGLSTLIAKSLVRRTGEQRYDLHELVRQFAAARLQAENNAQSATAERHVHYFLDLIAKRTQALADQRQRSVIIELNTDIDNIRLAWTEAIAQHNFTQLCACAWTIYYFFEMRGDYQEGCAFFQRAYAMIQPQLAQSDAERMTLEIAQSNLRIYWGGFLVRLGQSEDALALLTHSLTCLRQYNQLALLAEALWVSGMIAWNCGRFGQAVDYVEESLKLSHQFEHPWLITWSTLLLGGVSHEMGNFEKAYQCLHQGLTLSRELGDQRAIAFAISLLSRTAQALGYYDEMVTLLREAQQRAQATNDRYSMSLAAEFLGAAMHAFGNIAEACSLLEEGGRLYREMGDRWGMARVFNLMGAIGLTQADLPMARRYFIDALGAVQCVNVPVPILDAFAGLATYLAQTDAEIAALELVSVVQQHPAATQEARNRAEQVGADLASRLNAAQIATARDRFQGQPLEVVVAEVLRHLQNK